MVLLFLHVVAALLFKHKRAISMPEVYNNKLFHDGQQCLLSRKQHLIMIMLRLIHFLSIVYTYTTCINTIAESKRPVVLEAKPNNRKGTNSDTSFQK
jgi:hypothetical protein